MNELAALVLGVFLLVVGIALMAFFFRTAFWLVVKIPLAIILLVPGLVCCCTIILIPVGLWLFKLSFRLLIPGI